MGVFGKFKELVGIEDIEEDDEEETVEETKSIVPRQNPQIAAPARPMPSQSSAPMSKAATQAAVNKYTSTFKMVVIEPTGFDESPKLVDSLKAKKPVIINLESLETDTARKIFDFLSGATYALNGNVQKVANNIFVFAPENVNVDYKNDQKPSEKSSEKSPWR